MNRCQDKVLILTGAGGAQGRATAIRLGAEGARLVITDHSAPSLEDLAGELSEHGVEHLSRVLDVASESDWQQTVAAAEERFGGIDGLAHFAAVLSREGIEDTAVEDWERTIRVNLTGTWLGLRAMIPALRRRGGGAVVTIGSIDAVVGRAGAAAYQASKGGVRLLTKSAATEYATQGIRFNSVHPGPMEQRMLAVAGPSALASDEEGEQLLESLRSQIPVGRLGRADDIAAAVVYLLSDEASFVTGADFMIDGGLTAV